MCLKFFYVQAWLSVDRTDSAMDYKRDIVQAGAIKQLGGKMGGPAVGRRLGCGMFRVGDLGRGHGAKTFPRNALPSLTIDEEPTDNLSTMWP